MSAASPAAAAHSPPRPTPLLAAGNLAVQHLLRASGVQAKLTVSAPDDPLEREADRAAEQVVAAAGPGACPACAAGAPCAECGALVQRKALPSSTPGGSGGSLAHPRGPGEPLPSAHRSWFEARFGRDFGGVRVHAGSDAASAADQLQARAYTRGPDIVFARGEYDPASSRGRLLLAHELAHVIQQGGGDRLPDGDSSLTAAQAQIQRQVAPAPAAGAIDVPEPHPGVPDDGTLVRMLESQPGFTGGTLLAQLGGLRGAELHRPLAYALIRQRLEERLGRTVIDWLYRNDARIYRLVQNSDRLRLLAAERADHYRASGQTAAADRLWALMDDYEFDYGTAVDGYQRFGEAALIGWELLLGADPVETGWEFESAAREAQAAADDAAALAAERAEIGREAVGDTVATKEVLFWWDDTVTLEELLYPEDGTETEDEALARARWAGRGTAVLRRQGRYYVYALSESYEYDDIWEASQFEEHRTALVPEGTPVRALITTDGYVIRPRDGQRFFGGEQSERAHAYLAADLELLEEEAGSLHMESAFALFRQTLMDLVLTNLREAELRLLQAEGRLYGQMRPYPDPEAGAALQHNTAELRHFTLLAATRASEAGDPPTEEELDELADILERVGQLVTEDPTAAMMVINHRDEDDTGAPEPGDVEDRLEGMAPLRAARLAIDELASRRENIDRIRRYLHDDPDEVLAFGHLHEEVLQHFHGWDRFWLDLQMAFHTIEEMALSLGMAALELTLLGLGIFTGGLTAVLALGAGSALGVSQTIKQFQEVARLEAMTQLDLPGGFQLATEEQVSSARTWAWIGVGLTVLDLGGYVRSARHMARLRAVLASPDLAGLLTRSEQSLAGIARELGMSERTLLHQLSTLRGPARTALVNRIRAVEAARGTATDAAAGTARAAQQQADTGVLASRAIDGGAHELKATRSRRVVICSWPCEYLEQRYVREMTADPTLRTRLDEIHTRMRAAPEGSPDFDRAFQDAIDLEVELRALRRHYLGTDPGSARFIPHEAIAGEHIEQTLGRSIERLDPAVHTTKAGDYIDPVSGYSYDAMGPVPSAHFDLTSFTAQILSPTGGHMRKTGLDVLFIDLSGLNQAQVNGVLNFLTHMPPIRGPRIVVFRG